MAKNPVNERFKVDLRGIIDLAANHLYTSPDVFVREVIQNAVDAITARRRNDPTYQGSVRLELTEGKDDTPSTLCVTDDGIGLTTTEVHEFLSSVGGSSKREEAERKIEEEMGYLGRFGIGLLSCFMVADEIVVMTRSARAESAPAVEWRGRTDGSYAVREVPDSQMRPGTSVYLTAKEYVDEYFEREQLIELARQYAEMLPIKITVAIGGDEIGINRPQPAWEINSKDDIDLADICESTLGFRPIDTFRIESETGAVKGYAFIRPTRSEAWNGAHRLYAHGMFVSEHVHGLLPRWATFVGCILNTRGLKLTASREAIHYNDDLTKASEELGAAIRGRLAHLLRHDTNRFEAIMAVHDTEIRGLAVKDDDFFELIIDLLEFDTTLGRIRFGEFRREHDRLLVARTSEQFRRLSNVAAQSGYRVFNGGYTYHEELLCRAAERHPDLEVVSFDSADLAELWPEPNDPERYQTMADIGARANLGRNCEVVIRSFMPAEIPAYFALGLEAEFHEQLDRTKALASGLWNEILDVMAPRPKALTPTRLCLNTNNEMIQRLAAATDRELQRTAIEVLFVQALMSGQHPLQQDDLARLNAGMIRMLGYCTRLEGRP